MGGNQSNLNPPPQGFQHLCIAIRPSDKLLIIHGTHHLEISTIRQIIEEAWPTGIQREQYLFSGVHEFKLKGYPFQVFTSSTNAASWIMAGSILHRLHRDGWKLLISSNKTRTMNLTTWFFKKMPITAVSTRPLLIVGLCSTDTMVVVNAPENLHQMIRDVVQKSWPAGIKEWIPKSENTVLMIKLVGDPWHPHGQDTVSSRLLLQNLISDLYQQQWNLYGNSNLKSNINTLFFEYDPNIIPEGPSTAHLTVGLNKQDRLRLIAAPDSLVPVVRNAISTASIKIQKEQRYYQSWEFKLSGNPWFTPKRLVTKRTIIQLLEALQENGWSLITSVDSSRKRSDKSSFVFRESQPIQSPVLCLSLTGSNKLQLINAPQHIIDVTRQVVEAQWVLGIRSIEYDASELELELKGNPWNFGINGHDGILGRSLLCHLLEAFAIYQWKPVTSACVAVNYTHPCCPIDAHSIFFIKGATVAPPSAPLSQATGHQAPPLQSTGDPRRMPQDVFAQPGDPPPPYQPSDEAFI